MRLDTRSTGRFNRRRFVGGATGAAAAAALGHRVGAAPALRQGSGTPLEVWGGVPPENGPADLVAAFQEANPGIAVNYTRFVNDDTGNTQLDTALQGGTPIDLFFTYDIGRLAQRIGAGAADDLTPYVEADDALTTWVAETSGIFTYRDRLFSLPTTREPNFMFVNQRVLEEAGVPVPEAWTVDEFRALAQQLSDEGAGRFGAYAPPEVPRQVLGANHWYKEGGTESNFDHPVFRQWVELHRGMVDEESAFPWSEVLAQDLRAYAQTPFLTEQVALWPSSSFSLRYVNDKEEYPHDFVTTFAPLPTPAGVSPTFTPGGINNWLLMHPNARDKDAAWTFLRYWLTDGALYMLPGGKVPAYPGIEPETVVEGILGPDRETLYDVEAYRRVVFNPEITLVTDTVTTGAAEITQIVQGETDRCLIGEISPEEWATSVKQKADEAIQSAGA